MDTVSQTSERDKKTLLAPRNLVKKVVLIHKECILELFKKGEEK